MNGPLSPQWLHLTPVGETVAANFNFAEDACCAIEPGPDGVGTMVITADPGADNIHVQEAYEPLLARLFPTPAEAPPADTPTAKPTKKKAAQDAGA
jgi:hypothetical protein